MRNPGLVIYVLMKRTICKVIFASSIVVVLLFVCLFFNDTTTQSEYT